MKQSILEKKELLDVCRAELRKRGIPFIHVPNSIFIQTSMAVIQMFKHFPDILFLFAGQVYMREFGIGKRNPKQKFEQIKFMEKWKEYGADGKVIKDQGELLRDFQHIGIL